MKNEPQTRTAHDGNETAGVTSRGDRGERGAENTPPSTGDDRANAGDTMGFPGAPGPERVEAGSGDDGGVTGAGRESGAATTDGAGAATTEYAGGEIRGG